MNRRFAERLRWLYPALLAFLLLSGCSSQPKLDPVPPDQSADNAGQADANGGSDQTTTNDGSGQTATNDGSGQNAPGAPSDTADQEPVNSGNDQTGSDSPAAGGSQDGGQHDGSQDANQHAGGQNADQQDGNSSAGPNSDDQQGGASNAGQDGSGAAKPPVDLGAHDGTLIAVGDIMMHSPQLPGAYDSKTGLYDFKPFFASVKPLIEQGDWSLANLETPIAGKALGLSGYPRFNAPAELGDALKYAGFTTVTNANNHAMDRGSQGISMTLAKLQELGFVTKGTARSRWEADQLTIEKHNGISMGLLAYTYGTNGIPLPKNQPYAVSLIDQQAMIQDIHRLKAAGADFITVALHFGIEYQTAPNDSQKELARALIAAGADIIAGSHPHVVQPYEFAEVNNPDGSVRKGLIIYSMGNFISNQRGDTKDFGVIYQVGIHKDHGVTTLGTVKAIPTWVHRTTVKGLNHYAVVPIGTALASKTKAFPELSAADYSKLKSTYAMVTNRIESMHSKPVVLQATS